MFEPCDVLESLGNFDGVVASPASILTKQCAVRGEKCLLKTPENVISGTLIFQMSLDALDGTCVFGGASSKAA